MDWTGADATRLVDALEMKQPRFANHVGIHLNTVKKWKRRGVTIILEPFFAGLMDATLARATPVQRRRFFDSRSRHDILATSGVVELLPPVFDWGADPTTLAADLTRRDLLLDRREVTNAIAGLIVGIPLLEPLERWLLREPASTPRSFVAGAGADEIVELERAARVFRDWDDQFGGGLRRLAVVGQLREVNEMLAQSNSPATEQRLRRVEALLAEVAATMSWDSGDQQMAQQYYLLAVRAARAADDPALAANAMAGLARQLLALDHYGTAVQRAELQRERATDALEIIRLAQDRLGERVTPTVRAMLYTREAWAYGKLGRPTAFQRACEKAHDAYSASNPDEDPYWIHYFDSAELDGTIGGRLLEIARTDSSYARAAAESIESAISLRKPGRRRSSALDHLGIVEARLIEGEIEEACRLGHAAVEAVEQTGSDRVRKKLARVWDRTGQMESVGDVATLRDRMRPLVGAPA